MHRSNERCTVKPVLILVALFFFACGGGGGYAGSIGVRARRDPTSGVVLVTDVPAGLGGAKAGLEPGDRILAVDGVPVSQMTVDGFHRAVRGPIGSMVRLTIQRGDMIVDVEVERTALLEAKPKE
jgi:C-terminal processing protease CtpA/Prc